MTKQYFYFKFGDGPITCGHGSSSVRFICRCGNKNFFNRHLSNVTIEDDQMYVKCACGVIHSKTLARFDRPQ